MTPAEYSATLNGLETKVMNIAADHLQTSFDLERSIGFKEELKKRSEDDKPKPKSKPGKRRLRIKKT